MVGNGLLESALQQLHINFECLVVFRVCEGVKPVSEKLYLRLASQGQTELCRSKGGVWLFVVCVGLLDLPFITPTRVACRGDSPACMSWD